MAVPHALAAHQPLGGGLFCRKDRTRPFGQLLVQLDQDARVQLLRELEGVCIGGSLKACQRLTSAVDNAMLHVA